CSAYSSRHQIKTNEEAVMKARPTIGFLLIGWLVFASIAVQAQTTAFTYQGKLSDGGNPANGSYDFQFALFDSLAGGTPIGLTVTHAAVPVSGGVFAVQLDFGVDAFPGAERFLLISVRPAGGGSFSTLSPRQQISSTPYAIRTLSATAADSLSNACVNCVQNSHINSIAGSKVTGAIPVAGVPAGSGNYIQNALTQQSNADFNIAGSGTLATLNMSGTAASAVAPAGQARFFFNSATNKLRVSENGGAYVDLVGASGVSGSGTTNRLPLWSAGTTLTNSTISQ